jgi:hypothetical protein
MPSKAVIFDIALILSGSFVLTWIALVPSTLNGKELVLCMVALVASSTFLYLEKKEGR